MSRKFIITEEEKRRIKLLYEQLSQKDDVQIIDNKNPFNEMKYRDSIRDFSEKFKDGDIFVEWNYSKLKEKLLKLLKDKTVRLDDGNIAEIYGIDFIGLNNFDKINPKGLPFWELKLSSLNNNVDSVRFDKPELNDKQWKKKVYEFIIKNFPVVADLENENFLIKKIVKKHTDFNP